MLRFYITLLGLFYLTIADAQTPCTGTPPGAEVCGSSCLYCDLQGFVGNTTGYAAGANIPGCGAIGAVNNDQWFSFVANATTITFNSTPSGCVNGLQMALVPSCGGNAIVCDGGSAGGGGNVSTMTATNLTIGATYFLMVDGWDGAQCAFNINISPPGAVAAPDITQITGAITGDLTVCPGATESYTVPLVTGAGIYTWNGPPGTLVNGLPVPAVITGAGANTVSIKFPTTLPNGTVQVCVTPRNGCSTGTQSCININVQKIIVPPLPPITVCLEDLPYILPWGDVLPTGSTSGIKQKTLVSYQGCDSVVSMTVTIPQRTFNKPDVAICEGQTYTICGTPFTTGGQKTVTCTSLVTGCDSVIVQNLIVINPAAMITGSALWNCGQTTAVLNSTAPVGGGSYIKTWQSLPSGTQLGGGNTLNISGPGTYQLTILGIAAGVQCTATATFIVSPGGGAPQVTATGGNLCPTGSVALNGSSSTAGATFGWTGPGGFTSTSGNPTVSTAGTYVFTVTAPSGGCTAAANVVIAPNTPPAGVTATTSGSLTCTVSSVQLTGASSTSGVNFGWTGPGGFTSAIFNPTVGTAGVYTLTVTNPTSNCTATTTVTVTQNATQPNISAAGGALTCPSPSVVLNGGSSTAGVTYAWTGPGGFTSAIEDPSATTAGAYILTVTNPANNCTSSATATVTGSTTLPNATATAPSIGCGAGTFTLTGGSTTTGVSYAWTGPGGFTASTQNPAITVPGAYILTVTAANQCTASATATAANNTTVPQNLTATVSGPLTCTSGPVQLNSTSTSSPGINFAWTGPGGFTSNVANPNATVGGTYTVTATNPTNSCTSTATVTVTQNAAVPNATAVGGAISCTTPNLGLNGGSTTAGVTFAWTGPGGFTSAIEDPSATTAGAYILTVTNPANNCTSSATATVTGSTTVPNATATGPSIGCGAGPFNLTGGSTTSGVSYAWTGPGGFTASTQNPAITVPGGYILTVTAANQCTASATATAANNTTVPQNLTSTVSGPITCTALTVQLNATSTSSPGINFAWIGPSSFTSTNASPNATLGGVYTVTATNAANNCTSTSSVTVVNNVSVTNATATGGNISCTTPSATLNGNSTTLGVNFAWTGPGGFNSNIEDPSATAAGTYTLTVTNPANSCSATTTATITGNITPPNASATNATLGCQASVAVTGNSTTTGATYAWTGPSGFVAATANINAPISGNYILTVTAPNACTNSATAVVTNSITTPNISAAGGTLNCITPNVSLTGNSTTTGATYGWTGPGGFTASTANVTVNTAGDYTLTVTAPNACTSSQTVTVGTSAGLPDASAVSGTITCAVSSVTLDGQTTTAGATFGWTGPGGFTSALENVANITQGGVYTFTVTNPANGCSATANTTVQINNTNPSVSAVATPISCSTPNSTITTTTAATTLTYAWSGPGGFTSTDQNPIVNVGGTYNLTATNPTSGCAGTASVTIVADNNVPSAVAIGGEVNCANGGAIALAGSTNATMTVTYTWSGPGGFSSIQQNPTGISTPGIYTLSIEASNGCITTDTALVVNNVTTPVPDATVSGIINCTSPSASLNTTFAANTYAWSGPGGFTSSSQNPTVNAGGLYSLVVTASNGCTGSASATVVANQDVPTVALNNNTVLDCTNSSTVIANTINSPNSPVSTIAWTGPGGFSSTDEDPTVNAGGLYSVIITTQNGCSASASITVDQTVTLPNISATGDTLSCTITTGTLLGNSTTPNVNYTWAGPGGFTSNTQNPTVSTPGNYTLFVTAQNGCSSSQIVTLEQDANLPTGSIIAGFPLDCNQLQTLLIANSPTANATYAWSGGVINDTLTVIVAGDYNLVITAPNGCSVTLTSTVTQDLAQPGATATGSTIDCISGNTQITGNFVSLPAVSYLWDGPNGFTSTLQNPTVSNIGTYTLTTTAANGCTSSTTAQVSANTSAPVADLTASGNGLINCDQNTVTLTANIMTAGATGIWNGPNVTNDPNATITASIEGVYTYTVTGTNGCVSTPSVTVVADSQAPQDVTATDGEINCTNSSATLLGNTSTAGVSYAWTGPNGFTSNTQNPNVVFQGTYNLTVEAANGCTTTATAQVTSNQTIPDITIAPPAELNCQATSIPLVATSLVNTLTYGWVGPLGFVSTIPSPSIGTAGIYTLTVQGTNGCTNSASTVVGADQTLPVASAQGNTLTCAVTTIGISSDADITGSTFSWTGPNGFTSAVQNPNISAAGSYIVTVTAPNFCTSSATAVVQPDANAPVLSVTGGTIDCINADVTLTSSSSSNQVDYAWTGPNGFTSTIPNPTVTLNGQYTLVITDQVNGCSATQTATVQQQISVPSISFGNVPEIGCTTTQVTIPASVSPAGIYTYTWTTANGNILSGVDQPIASANQPGSYNLLVTNVTNGCTTEATAQVDVSTDVPSIPEALKKDISCYGRTDGAVVLSAVQGGTPPYLFSFDNMPYSTTSTFTNLTPGVHTLTIQDAEGCEISSSYTIAEPEELVVYLGGDTTIFLGQYLDIKLDTTLQDIVNLPGRIDTFILNPIDILLRTCDTCLITQSFKYSVTVIDSNGCKATDERLILVDKKRNIFIPNIFVSGANSDNALFTIFGGIDVNKIKTFRVFDRWGDGIHEVLDFPIEYNIQAAWDGTFRGKPVLPGVYVYQFEVEFKDGAVEMYRGDVTVVR